MLGLLSRFLLGGAARSLVSAGTEFATRVVTGDKVERERHANEEQIALRRQVTAEAAQAMAHRTWFDSLVDGINRVVRPAFTLGIAALFIWCAVDPVAFAATMQALGLMPEPLWIIMGTVLAFWFGERTILTGKFGSTATATKVGAVLKTAKEIRKLAPPPPEPAPRTAPREIRESPAGADVAPANDNPQSAPGTVRAGSPSATPAPLPRPQAGGAALHSTIPAIEAWLQAAGRI